MYLLIYLPMHLPAYISMHLFVYLLVYMPTYLLHVSGWPGGCRFPHHPRYHQIQSILNAGTLGAPRTVSSTFYFSGSFTTLELLPWEPSSLTRKLSANR